VISLTKSVATILGPHKIRANVIIPGFVLKGPPADAREAALAKQRGQMVPVRRLGEWWELGPLCVFLASELDFIHLEEPVEAESPGQISCGVSFSPREVLRC
jgi:NAD(P)-dependent dehydrogenase (short-subunit alcohol dehydrogenase family)